jgi:hypothetical protein
MAKIKQHVPLRLLAHTGESMSKETSQSVQSSPPLANPPFLPASFAFSLPGSKLPELVLPPSEAISLCDNGQDQTSAFRKRRCEVGRVGKVGGWNTTYDLLLGHAGEAGVFGIGLPALGGDGLHFLLRAIGEVAGVGLERGRGLVEGPRALRKMTSMG